MDKIKLESRYKDIETYYNSIDENKGVIITNGSYVRCILDEGTLQKSHIKAIDFEGGPMLSVGDTMIGTNKKIKNIKACYYVELE